MARFEFDGRFAFPDGASQAAFAADVKGYIDSNGSAFIGYPPVNASISYHGVTVQHVQARFATRQSLGGLFSAMKTVAQQHGAVAPSSMWLKTVADTGGVTEGVGADAPAWTDYAVV